jgi:hypothetical protein
MRAVSKIHGPIPPPGSQQFAELQHFAIKYQDATLAITIATEFADHSQREHEVDNFFAALSWLQKARDFNPDHPFFNQPENVQNFLSYFSCNALRAMSFLFIDDKSEWLLKALQDCPKCDQIVIYNFHCMNQKFSEFIASASHLKQITLAFDQPLHNESFSTLLAGLEKNTSLEVLILRGQLRGDEDIDCLLKVIHNPHCKIHTLDLRNCHINEAGANVLLEFVINSKQMKHLYLENNLFSKMTLNNIQRALLFTQYRPAVVPQYRHALQMSDCANHMMDRADAEVASILNRAGIPF